MAGAKSAREGLSARGLVSVVSATILVACQAITVAIAAGWAIAGLFGLGNIGEYALMALFGLLAAYVSLLYVKKAIVAETNAHY
ncbi:hypothetical protein GCM10007301_43970 [Azorhizobium oxalatiphilum]|uniref:Uncharacterized protein n=1 Tax=Azorhizobium oxalatiphilum TaxID=980631 RepID=A0A917FHL6_9HYPH|nr:hypothetical protein [Azorhizobium oxalatiphilum]GGF79167.1 hypothetical protein GCM10007301_43970 [Azorhizobium oxalatiphilum]